MNGSIAPRRRMCGATLVELVVSVVVLSVSITGILMVIAQTVQHSADPMRLTQANAIAQAYMEEILSRAPTDPAGGDTGGPEAGEQRATYDDVNDYDGLSDQGVIDQNGQPVAGLAAWRVNVSVRPGTLEGANGQRIEVRVRHAADADFTLSLAAWRFE